MAYRITLFDLGEAGEAAALQKIPGHPGYTTDEMFSLEAIGMVVNSTTEALFLALAKSKLSLTLN